MTVAWPEIYPADIPGKLPVCFECGIPGCAWRTYHKDNASAEREKARHIINTCPMELQIDMSIISELWDEVDKTVVYLRTKIEDKGTEPYFKAQGKAQGLAAAIYLMSRPHFENPQAVAAHAGARYKAHAADQPMPDTPGCNGHSPLPAAVAKQKVAQEVRKVKEQEAVEGKIAEVPDETRTMVMNAHKAKLPVASIAKVTKLSVAQVEGIISLEEATKKIDAS